MAVDRVAANAASCERRYIAAGMVVTLLSNFQERGIDAEAESVGTKAWDQS